MCYRGRTTQGRHCHQDMRHLHMRQSVLLRTGCICLGPAHACHEQYEEDCFSNANDQSLHCVPYEPPTPPHPSNTHTHTHTHTLPSYSGYLRCSEQQSYSLYPPTSHLPPHTHTRTHLKCIVQVLPAVAGADAHTAAGHQQRSRGEANHHHRDVALWTQHQGGGQAAAGGSSRGQQGEQLVHTSPFDGQADGQLGEWECEVGSLVLEHPTAQWQ
jgi:hypothetical protein